MRIGLTLLSFLVLLSCHTSAQPAKTPAPFVTWDKSSIELGAVKKGEKRAMQYAFTNTSGENIQIDIVDACDCTKVDFPRGVIAPGETRRLDVVFDSSEKEASETIEIRVIFTNMTPAGIPRIETVSYKFDLVR